MILRFLFTEGVQEFARGLAENMARRFPAAIANSPEALVSQRRRSEIFESVFSPARQFSLEKRLGVLGRVRLQSALRWQLREMGYEEKFIDMADEYLTKSVTRPAK